MIVVRPLEKKRRKREKEAVAFFPCFLKWMQHSTRGQTSSSFLHRAVLTVSKSYDQIKGLINLIDGRVPLSSALTHWGHTHRRVKYVFGRKVLFLLPLLPLLLQSQLSKKFTSNSALFCQSIFCACPLLLNFLSLDLSQPNTVFMCVYICTLHTFVDEIKCTSYSKHREKSSTDDFAFEHRELAESSASQVLIFIIAPLRLVGNWQAREAKRLYPSERNAQNSSSDCRAKKFQRLMTRARTASESYQVLFIIKMHGCSSVSGLCVHHLTRILYWRTALSVILLTVRHNLFLSSFPSSSLRFLRIWQPFTWKSKRKRKIEESLALLDFSKLDWICFCCYFPSVFTAFFKIAPLRRVNW